MAQVVVTYKTLKDPAAFNKCYAERHPSESSRRPLMHVEIFPVAS
jgi:hypothetical protein